jgi:hypothetical protein
VQRIRPWTAENEAILIAVAAADGRLCERTADAFGAATGDAGWRPADNPPGRRIVLALKTFSSPKRFRFPTMTIKATLVGAVWRIGRGRATSYERDLRRLIGERWRQ